jgi:hypothetical protein
MKNIIEYSKETAKMNKEYTNLIVGAVLSGQKRVMIQGMEVSWKPLKANLNTKQRETEAKKIAKLNLSVILG